MRLGVRVLGLLRLLGVAAVVVTVVSIPFRAGAQSVQSTPQSTPQLTQQTSRPTLRVAVWPVAPFIVSEGDGQYSGFSIDLLGDIADAVGFDVAYVPVDSVGAQLEAVRTGQADLAISAISITSAREKFIDYSGSMFESGIQVMVANSTGELSPLTFLRNIFSPTVLFVFMLMVVGTILTGVFVWAWERRHGNDHFTNEGAHGIFDGIWWATVTLFTIGYGDKVPHKVLSRIVTMAWMFVGVMMVAIVTAQVTSSVTVERLEASISSVSDLAGKDVITYPGTTSWDYLLGHGVDPRPVDSIDDAYRQVRSGEADAFVFDASIIQWLVANRSGVKAAGPIIQPENYGIVFPQGSSWIEPVNQSLLRLRENGQYERLKKSYFG